MLKNVNFLREYKLPVSSSIRNFVKKHKFLPKAFLGYFSSHLAMETVGRSDGMNPCAKTAKSLIDVLEEDLEVKLDKEKIYTQYKNYLSNLRRVFKEKSSAPEIELDEDGYYEYFFSPAIFKERRNRILKMPGVKRLSQLAKQYPEFSSIIYVIYILHSSY